MKHLLMAFDYYAKSIWSIDEGEAARVELASLQSAGLLSRAGVRNWDWQETLASNWKDKVRWWATGLTTAPAQTFDWGIANVVAGNLHEAFKLERDWLKVQRPDGGFAGCYLFGLRIPIDPPTSYTAARFILFERMLTEAATYPQA